MVLLFYYSFPKNDWLEYEETLKINYLLYFRKYSGCKSQQITGIRSIDELFQYLKKEYEDFQKYVFTASFPEESFDLTLLVNGIYIDNDKPNVILEEDDIVTLIPVIMGG